MNPREGADEDGIQPLHEGRQRKTETLDPEGKGRDQQQEGVPHGTPRLKNVSSSGRTAHGGGLFGAHPTSGRCLLCRRSLETDRPGYPEVEIKAYLPCGHSFGHICLFGLMHMRRRTALCPVKDCKISLRHSCGHLVIPSMTRPEAFFQDTAADVMPSPCPYCASPTGQRKRERLEKWTTKYHHAQTCGETSGILRKTWEETKQTVFLKQINHIERQLEFGHNRHNCIV